MKRILLIALLSLVTAFGYSQTAADYYKKALDAANKRAYIYVEDFMDKAIAIDPSNANYYLLRAKSNTVETSDTLKYVKALNDYSKALALGLKNAEVYNGMASVQKEMSSILWLEAKNKQDNPVILQRSNYYKRLAEENSQKALN